MRATSNTVEGGNEKLSRQFASRMSRLNPHEKVRVILLINSQPPGTPTRDFRARRRAAIEAAKKAAGQALGSVDGILERFGGRRLSSLPNALGGVVVETTPKGVLALADSQHVRAILEDQPIRALHSPVR